MYLQSGDESQWLKRHRQSFEAQTGDRPGASSAAADNRRLVTKLRPYDNPAGHLGLFIWRAARSLTDLLPSNAADLVVPRGRTSSGNRPFDRSLLA